MNSDNDSYSSWLAEEASRYAKLSSDTELAFDLGQVCDAARVSDQKVSWAALMYYKGLSDGFNRARRHYLEGLQ